MRHVEFLDAGHFEENYFRKYPSGKLSEYIDFFWETRFDALLETNAAEFSDVLFPNTGYSYLINIGTPYVMMVGDKRFPIKGDSFLPRHKRIQCFHKTGNRIFGVKFRLSPVLLEKKVDFSEYRKGMSPLSYLIEKDVVEEVKGANHFSERVELLVAYFTGIIKKNSSASTPVATVSKILRECFEKNSFDNSIEELAEQSGVSSRTLHRYFECATSLSSKKTLQLMRIRKAVDEMARNPKWDVSKYGYYDYSHFYRHLVQFMGKEDAEAFLKTRRRTG